MGIYDELRKQGYEFEYEHGCSEDRAEVWINKEAKMAVRIEWMKMDEVEPCSHQQKLTWRRRSGS